MPIREEGQIGIRVRPLTTGLRDDLQKTLDRIERSMKIEVPIHLTLSRDEIAGIKRQLAAIDDATVDIKADLDDAAVKAGLARLSRDQTATIEADADTAAADKQLDVLTRDRKTTVDVDMDTSVFDTFATAFSRLSVGGGLALASSGIVGLTGATMAAIPEVLSLASSMSTLAGIYPALLGPMIAMKAATFAVSTAFTDLNKRIPALASSWKKLQQNVGNAFWKDIQTDFMSLANSTLPQLQDGLSSTAQIMGGTMMNALNALAGSVDLPLLFKDMNAGLSAMSAAAGRFGAAAGPLAQIAMSYMPALGKAVADVATRFEQWVAVAESNGTIDRMILEAVAGFKQLFSIVGSVISIFQSLNAAMGGTTTLAVVAIVLRQIADALKTVQAQTSITTFFNNARAAAVAMAPGLKQLGIVLGTLLDTIVRIAPQAGAAFSALMSVIGPGLQQILPVVGQVLSAFYRWVAANPQLALTLTTVAAGIALAAVGVGKIIGVVASVVSFVQMLGPLLTAMGTSWSAIGAAVAGAVLPFVAVVAAIAAVAAILVYAWNTSEQFRNAVMGLGAAIMGLLQPIIAFVQGTVMPVLQQVTAAVMAGITRIMAALVPLLTTMAQIATQIIAYLIPIISFIMSVLAPVFTFLGTVVSAAFTFISTVISTALNIINAVLQVFLNVLRGNWSGAWKAIQNLLSVVWSSMKTLVQAAITFVGTVIRGGLQMISAVWSAIWNAIKALLSAAWAGIQATVSAGANLIRSVITTAMNTIRTIMTTVWNTVKTTVSTAWNGIKTAVTTGISSVLSLVGSLPGKITGALGDLGGLLVSSGRSLMDGFANGIRNAIGAVTGAVSSAMDAVMQFIPHSPAPEGPLSGPGWRSLLSGGSAIGEQVADGVLASQAAIENAMVSLLTPLSADALDVSANADLTVGGRPGVGGGNTFNFYNPVAEPASRSIQKASSDLTLEV